MAACVTGMLRDFDERGSGMVAKRARLLWRAGCGLLVTIGLLGLLVGDGGTSGGSLERPNSLDVAWSFRTSGRALDVSDLPAAVSDRMLAVPQGGTVTVVDSRDGRFLSSARSSADRFTPLGFSGGVMLAVEQWFGQGGKTVLNAYDPATGRKLWHKTAGPNLRKGNKDAWLGQAPFLLDPGPAMELADGRLAGVAPRTGAVTWTRRKPALAPCDQPDPDDPRLPPSPFNVATTANYLVVLKGCPGRTAELEMMNVRDGVSVWEKDLGRSRDSVKVSAVRGVIGVSLDNDLRLFTESGEQILRRKADGKSGLWPLGEARGVVYLSESDDTGQAGAGSSRSHTLHAVRADTGRTLWTRSQGVTANNSLTSEAIVGEVEVAGAYGGDLRWLPGDARLQGPGASSLMDPEGRGSAPVPWPVAGTFVGMSGDLLIVRSEEKDGTRYTALRPSHRAVDAERPAALGGVERQEWPDACGLISAELLAELGRNYVKLPVPSSRKVLGTRLPRPSVCRFATESGSDDGIFSVTVRWVAPDAKAAETYATSVIPWGCAPALGGCVTAEIAKPRRGVHLYTYRTGLEQLPVAHATVVSGRYVLGISAGNDKARTQRLIRRVAMHLAEQADRLG
ncbi:PQQ-binding-like beta-propeller repeat protein [Streptomyces viridochromogenes]|uniref:outer membrane protein assembly factor BamB family protein n=1 Tax=Streptomyces viridochromogenes TaxID=1938 RepID=UPI00099C749E|nr:PQQ-binding-like beta-propeller repeat protein [Streptomyces viridochromogenes]